MEKVIQVKNIGKKYLISHQGIQAYQTLREAISNSAKKILPKNRMAKSTIEVFWALRSISFDALAGERIGIIGRNGAGKSTLLKVLSRITEPTEGRAIIKGKVASLLEVGTGFHQELTGRENIFLNGSILGMTRANIKKKFNEIVEFAEIEKFLDTPVKRYSSGMYVRLAFAVAAYLEPDILLVDEILAVGDAQYQKKSLNKMESVSKDEGRTILFVSHNMSSISKLCSRCIWISEGKILMDDLSNKVVSNYLSSNLDKEGEILWNSDKTAPGDKDYIHFLSVKLFNSKRENTNAIYAEDAFYIELKYKVLKRMNISQIGFKIVASSGEALFYSGDMDLSSNKLIEREPGVYTSTCEIYPFLLNQGIHSISLYGHIPGYKILVEEENILSFEVLQKKDIGGYGKQPGLMRPKLKWDIELLEK